MGWLKGSRTRAYILAGSVSVLALGISGWAALRTYEPDRTFLSDVNGDGINDLVLEKPGFWRSEISVYIGEKEGSYTELGDYLKREENPEKTRRVIESKVERLVEN